MGPETNTPWGIRRKRRQVQRIGKIEVRIGKPNLKVYAKDGYYPAAPLKK